MASPAPSEATSELEAFHAHLAPGERRRAITGALLAASLMPAFMPVDYLVYPRQAHLLWSIRAVLFVLALGGAAAARSARTYRQITAVTVALFVAFGAGIALMTPFIGGSQSEYYGGIAQVFVGAAVLFTWPTWLACAVSLAVLLCYYAPIAFERAVSVPALVVHTGFLLGTAAVAVVCMRQRVLLSLQEFLATQALARSNAALKDLNQAKDILFQNISHEFRTPLTLILAPVESLLESQPEPARRRAFETIRDNALRLLNLVNDLLDLAKLSTVKVTVEPSPVQVGSVLEQLAREASELAKRQGLTFEVRLGAALPAYLLDLRYFEKVVLNLLSNAFKFTPAGGTVALAADDDGAAGLTVSVRDTGPGISPEERARLFQRFEQLHGGSARHAGGTGIGLALVQELTGLMGGKVGLQSEVGSGSTFSVHFPAGLRVASASAVAEPSSGSAVAAMSRKAAFAALGAERRGTAVWRAGERGPSVLVAEDDPGLSRQLLDLLSPHYRVSAVGNGRAALELAIQAPPHLILSDVMMPEMDGLQLAAALRDLPALRETPIVLLSARAELDDRVRGRRSGVDTYLTKPFHPQELLATLEGLLRSRLRVVGPYVLHAPLGKGGQSEIFLGEHVHTGEQAALKLLGRDAAEGPARDRLRREAEVLQRLRHPNVVRVLSHGFVENRAYLAMELLEGATVRQLLDAQSRLDAAAAVAVARALADALAAVHAAGLLHRDVKCENAMILRGGESIAERVRLIDFGIVHDTGSQTLTPGGEVIGTLTYLAPEVVGGGKASPQSDLYALGVVLFAMCTGSVPFQELEAAALVNAILRRGVPRADTVRPDLPPALVELLASATALDPAARPGSAAELRDALDGLALGPGVLSSVFFGEANDGQHATSEVTRGVGEQAAAAK